MFENTETEVAVVWILSEKRAYLVWAARWAPTAAASGQEKEGRL